MLAREAITGIALVADLAYHFIASWHVYVQAVAFGKAYLLLLLHRLCHVVAHQDSGSAVLLLLLLEVRSRAESILGSTSVFLAVNVALAPDTAEKVFPRLVGGQVRHSRDEDVEVSTAFGVRGKVLRNSNVLEFQPCFFKPSFQMFCL